MKVGIFHWSFDFFGGGEKVAFDMAEALGLREVYTLFREREYNSIKAVDVSHLLPRWAKLLGKISIRKRSLDKLLWEVIDVTEIADFDLILTSGPTPRAIITPEHIPHVNVCYSVPRWLWDLWHYRHRWKNYRTFIFAEVFRLMDVVVDSRVDYYITISELIKRRLWKYMKRDSEILYPSIKTEKYRFREYGDFFLHMGRFDKIKQIPPVLKACEKAGVKLVLTGYPGTDKEVFDYIRKHNGNGVIEFVGYVDEKTKLELLSSCKAVIYNPINEDFWIIPVEALASGKPVIVNNTGYPPMLIRKTGLIEKCGVLEVYRGGIVTRGDVNTILHAIELVDSYEWDPYTMKEYTHQFDFAVFRNRLNYLLTMWKKEFEEMLSGNEVYAVCGAVKK